MSQVKLTRAQRAQLQNLLDKGNTGAKGSGYRAQDILEQRGLIVFVRTGSHQGHYAITNAGRAELGAPAVDGDP